MFAYKFMQVRDLRRLGPTRNGRHCLPPRVDIAMDILRTTHASEHRPYHSSPGVQTMLMLYSALLVESNVLIATK